MECKHCGGTLEQGHNFCPHCGEKIEKELPKEEAVVVEEKVDTNVPPEAIEEIKEVRKDTGITKVQFSTLLFSIMFIFSVLAMAMVMQVEYELRIMQQEIYSLHQKIGTDAKDTSKEKQASITGEHVQVSHIEHFSYGRIHTIMVNIQVPEGVLFNGVAVDELPKTAKKAFAHELIQTNWSRISEEAYECYPNLEVQLLVNDKPYARHDGQQIRLYK